ncbi:MAG: hypothetical protein WBA77_04460 [Microcoleaceae cyanobacterium]
MHTQKNTKYFVSHSQDDHRLIWIAIIMFSSLTVGLLPIINFLNVPVPGNTIPHEAGLWDSIGYKE